MNAGGVIAIGGTAAITLGPLVLSAKAKARERRWRREREAAAAAERLRAMRVEYGRTPPDERVELMQRVVLEGRRREYLSLTEPMMFTPGRPRRLPSFDQLEAIFALPLAPDRDPWPDPSVFRAERDAIRRLPMTEDPHEAEGWLL
jgi:hypothetical protein